MKKINLSSVVLTIFVMGFFGLVYLASLDSESGENPFDYARITDVDYTAVVVDEPGTESKIVITERLTFDIHAFSRSNTFWELWRDLPEDTVDGLPIYYKVNSVKQLLSDGSELVYEESPVLYWEDYDYVRENKELGPEKWFHSEGPYNESMRQYECVMLYIDDVYREEMVFEIEYEMYNAALKYNDCSDLYISMFSEDSCKYLESYKGRILIPEKDMPAEGNYEFYTYGTRKGRFDVTESDTLNPGYHTFSFELDKKDLKFDRDNMYIEFDLFSFGDDRHSFTDYAPDNVYSDDDVLEELRSDQQRYAAEMHSALITRILSLLICILIGVGILIYAFTLKVRMNRKYVFFKPTVPVQSYRDITEGMDPALAATILTCKDAAKKDDSGIYSALLLSLARKDYIELQDTGFDDMYITLKPPRITPVTPQPQETYFSFTPQEPVMPLAPQEEESWDTPFSAEPASVTPDFADPFATPVADPFTAPVADPFATPVTEPVLPETREPLSEAEEHYFNLLMFYANNNMVQMSTFQMHVASDYEETHEFTEKIQSAILTDGINGGYFQKAFYKEPSRKIETAATILLVVGILAILWGLISLCSGTLFKFTNVLCIAIPCFVAAFYFKRTKNKYVLLTQRGENEYTRLRGFYQFLNSETLMRERSHVELPLWERYLVYATAFGISEKVIKAMELHFAEKPEYEESPVLRHRYIRSGRYHHTSHSFRHASRSYSASRHSSGYGGGGFGYGGGGRGGGGGGGGH